MKWGCNEPDSLGHALALVEVVGMIPGAPIFWALALSIALNAALGWAYLGQRDKTTEAQSAVTAMEQQRDGARGGQRMQRRRGRPAQRGRPARGRGQGRTRRGRRQGP